MAKKILFVFNIITIIKKRTMEVNNVSKPSFKSVIMANSMKNYLKNPMKAMRFDDFKKEIEPMFMNHFYVEHVGGDILQIGITNSDPISPYLTKGFLKLSKKQKKFLEHMKMLHEAFLKNNEKVLDTLVGYVNLNEMPSKQAAERVIDAARFFNTTVVGLN